MADINHGKHDRDTADVHLATPTKLPKSQRKVKTTNSLTFNRAPLLLFSPSYLSLYGFVLKCSLGTYVCVDITVFLSIIFILYTEKLYAAGTETSESCPSSHVNFLHIQSAPVSGPRAVYVVSEPGSACRGKLTDGELQEKNFIIHRISAHVEIPSSIQISLFEFCLDGTRTSGISDTELLAPFERRGKEHKSFLLNTQQQYTVYSAYNEQQKLLSKLRTSNYQNEP